MTLIASCRAATLGLGLAAAFASAAYAETYDITVDRIPIDTGEFTKTGIGYNGSQTPKILRFKEGEEVTINVTNNLSEDTSIHWHGLILPYDQDGVPGISYVGIAAGETFTYRFPIKQAGTYWFHSHTRFQEPDGAYGAIVIEPKEREPMRYDRDYVVQLTDKHPHSGSRIMRNLKMMPDYYNRQQRTLFDFLEDAREKGVGATLEERAMWGNMRMMPTDVEDVQGFTPLINGRGPDQNWTGLFVPGERVRLRFINSSAMTYFDVRIPGLKMTVVQADGNDVSPVPVDEFRIAVAETYDVIVQPAEDRAYSILAETMGRTAMARGTLAPREGMESELPGLRKPPRLTMADMGMDHGSMAGMDHDSMAGTGQGDMAGMDHSTMDHSAMGHGTEGATQAMPDGTAMPGMAHAGHGDGGPAAAAEQDPYYAPGSGLAPQAYNGGRFLSYNDLRAQKPLYRDREATRTIELRLTGNMERYGWSINGVKYADADPIRLRYGERVRFKFVNETMMTHPMHLHGMWTILDTGKGEWDPVKHTVSIAPGTTVYTETEVDAPGQWAFHCHLTYHAESGMFRKVVVEGGPDDRRANAAASPATGG